METTVMEKESAKKSELCLLTIKKTLGGMTVNVKSEVFEQFFKTVSENSVKSSENSKWSKGHKYYNFEHITVPRADYTNTINVKGFGNYEIIDADNGLYDFSFLKAVGIGTGIEFKCNGLILQESIERFQKDLKKFITTFYIQYMKISTVEIKITTIN